MTARQLAAVKAATKRRDQAQAAWVDALVVAAQTHTLAEVARAAGITRGRVSQIVGPVGRKPGRRSG